MKKNILYEYQFGLTPGKNTTQAILSLVDYIIDSFENNEIGCDIFLEIFKAFDTMDRSIIVGNLSKYGIRDVTSNWLKSYQVLLL